MSFVDHIVGNVYALRWLEPVSSDAARVLERVRALHAEVGEVVYIGITDDESGRPDAEMKRRVLESVDELLPLTRGYYLIVSATGFRAAILRGVIAGMALTFRPGSGIRVLESVDQALEIEAAKRTLDRYAVLDELVAAGVVR